MPMHIDDLRLRCGGGGGRGFRLHINDLRLCLWRGGRGLPMHIDDLRLRRGRGGRGASVHLRLVLRRVHCLISRMRLRRMRFATMTLHLCGRGVRLICGVRQHGMLPARLTMPCGGVD